MRAYTLSERAAKDLTAVQDWYDQRGVDLGNRFVHDVMIALRVARERPMSCPQVGGRIRAVRCKRFPYRIYFVPLDDRIDVLAIYHTARNPSSWDDPHRE
jgi:toxin ParE1/3/4